MNHRTKVNEIVARCRRIGWGVEMGEGKEWLFRIQPPEPHPPVFLHSSPSDVNWHRTVLRSLNHAGLAVAEKEYLAAEAVRRQETLAAQRTKADAKAAQLAAQSRAIKAAAGPYAEPEEFDVAWLTSPSSFPQTRTGILTPHAAKHMLDTMNIHNRKRSDARVRFFEDLIRTKTFKCTHQGFSIDSNGVLQDGQSRAEAVVNTGTPVKVMISVGMPPENFPALDSGGPRTARDVAFIMGEDDPGAVATAAKVLVIVDDHGADAYAKSKNRMSNGAIAQAIERYGEGLRIAVARAKEIRKDVRRASLAAVSAGVFMLARQMPDGDPRVERFLDDLRYGLDGRRHKGDPVYKLRAALIDGPSDSRRHYDMFEQLALFTKAWNLRVLGQKRQNLVWRRDQGFPAPMLPPSIDEDPHWAKLRETHA